jgi:hypothetical protein
LLLFKNPFSKIYIKESQLESANNALRFTIAMGLPLLQDVIGKTVGVSAKINATLYDENGDPRKLEMTLEQISHMLLAKVRRSSGTLRRPAASSRVTPAGETGVFLLRRHLSCCVYNAGQHGAGKQPLSLRGRGDILHIGGSADRPSAVLHGHHAH